MYKWPMNWRHFVMEYLELEFLKHIGVVHQRSNVCFMMMRSSILWVDNCNALFYPVSRIKSKTAFECWSQKSRCQMTIGRLCRVATHLEKLEKSLGKVGN